MRSLALPFALIFGAGCSEASSELDGELDSFQTDGKADAFGVADKTPDALGVLRLVNAADRVTLEGLGLSERAIDALLVRRAGADRVLGTHDDHEITSLTRLDDVAWVGPLTFERLYAGAGDGGYIEPFGLGLPAVPRLVALGDLHGDLEATRQALRLAGAIDARDRWIGDDLVVVQAGDVLDREDDERDILDLFDRLEADAAAAGGRLIRMLGNHELMNAQGDFRYVTDAGFAAYSDVEPTDPKDPRVRAFPKAQRGRAAAFLQGGPIARRLARHDVVVEVGDTLFVHGGLSTSHVTYGLERLDYEARAYLLWDDLATPAILDADNGPLWMRDQGDDETINCASLDRMLAAAGASRLVIAHSVQESGITSACDGAVWRIDVGMSTAYGGPIQVLEILDSTDVRVLAR